MLSDAISWCLNSKLLYSILLLLAFCLFLVVGLKQKKYKAKLLFFNISAVFFAFFGFESLLVTSDFLNHRSEKLEILFPEKYFSTDHFLGFGPQKDGVFRSRAIISKSQQILYDVHYTIQDGIRLTPNSNFDSKHYAIFFGCSFTFGAGLDDSSTVPFYFNQVSTTKYNVFNFGFHGYGPHQMLALLEKQSENNFYQYCTAGSFAVFSFIPDHFRRAAGFTSWDKKGPRYEVINDRLVRIGNFSQNETRWSKLIATLFRNFKIYNLFFNPNYKKPHKKDVVRVVEIFKAARAILNKAGIPLYLVIWNIDSSNTKLFDFFIEELRKNKLDYIMLTDMVPDFEANKSFFLIHKLDEHPNQRINRIIAEYLVTYRQNK